MTKVVKKWIKGLIEKLLTRSLRASNVERQESALKEMLIRSTPDLSRQYSTFDIDSPHLIEKLRCLHAFQIGLVMKTLELMGSTSANAPITLVDIGDSSGTHLKYVKDIAGFRKLNLNLKLLSANLDPVAVKKIQDRGMDALLCRAEELPTKGIEADIFVSFQMLEHLFDPISFLHDIASKTNCSYFVITIPYVRTSRVGLHYLRWGDFKDYWAENTHIFELSVEDWNLIFRFSGWEIVSSDIYTQYPKFGLLRLTKPLWSRLDFEGFYGVILRRNLEISKHYKSWPD
jgi:hypothetical protein